MNTVDLINTPSDEIYGIILPYLKRTTPGVEGKIYVSRSRGPGRFAGLSSQLGIAVEASSKLEAAVLLELLQVIIDNESLDDLIDDTLADLQATYMNPIIWGGRSLPPGVYPIDMVLEDMSELELPNLLEYDIPPGVDVALQLNEITRPLHDIDIWDIDRIIEIAASS